MPRPDSDPDVLILGAGVAGLAAARDLAQAGRRVAIVEGRDRIGGRIHTLRPPGTTLPVELGAEFVHGRPPATWELIREGGLAVVPFAERHQQVAGGRLHPAELEWDAVAEVLGALDPKGPDRSLADWLDQHRSEPAVERAGPILRRYVEGFHAARLDRIGIRALAVAESGEGSGASEAFRLLGGYDRIPKLLLEDAPSERITLHLGAPVRAVRWEPGRVEVELADSDRPVLTAPRAVITLPLGVLKAPAGRPGQVVFDPPLTGKQAALDQLEMGPVVRLVLRFREVWWPEEMGFLHPPSDATFGPWWTASPVVAPILTAWAGGPRAGGLTGCTTEQLTELALNELAQLWARPAAGLRDLLAGAWHHDWTGDPLALGGYSYGGVGGEDAPARLAEPIAATLFLAGEATAPEGQNGTVPGAMTSGYRAAREILAARD